jgi:hypothetical protein
MAADSLYVADSLGMVEAIPIERAPFSIVNFFVEGGLGGMIIITVLLIALLAAAWKAPNWVKEIGIAALVVSVFWTVCGLHQAAGVIQMAGDISPAVVWGGVKVMTISLLYGLAVYFLSLIIRIIQKPRI